MNSQKKYIVYYPTSNKFSVGFAPKQAIHVRQPMIKNTLVPQLKELASADNNCTKSLCSDKKE
jgi:hypothetical protein